MSTHAQVVFCSGKSDDSMLVAQSGPVVLDPMDCHPPGSSVRGILQARILEWVAISFSRDLPYPRIEPGSPALQADSLLSEPPGKPKSEDSCLQITNLKHDPSNHL